MNCNLEQSQKNSLYINDKQHSNSLIRSDQVFTVTNLPYILKSLCSLLTTEAYGLISVVWITSGYLSGHYTAYTHTNGVWYRYDDEQVTKVTTRRKLTTYLFVYSFIYLIIINFRCHKITFLRKGMIKTIYSLALVSQMTSML